MTIDLFAPNPATMLPLFVLVSAAACILLLDLRAAPRQVSGWMALASLILAAVLALLTAASGQSGVIHGMLGSDGLSTLFTLYFCGAGAAFVLRELPEPGTDSGPFAFVLFAISGALAIAQATHTLPLMIGLAILHVATTVLVGPQRGWSYPIVQSAALACVLFGTTLWYGASGTLSLDPPGEVQTTASNSLAALGIGIAIAGLSQWWGLEPWGAFQWAPHTGQAPTPRGLLIALILPGAAAAAMSRLSGALAGPWLAVLAVLGSLSLVVGYLRALCSYRIADMLHGIAAAQAGILALALVCRPAVGWAPFFYLLASNALSLLGLWAAISDGDTSSRDDVAGLGQKRPWLAAGATLCLLNLAGMSPLAGIAGQTALLQASTQEGYRWIWAPLAASSFAIWLLTARWILTLWIHLPQDRPWKRTAPEVTLIALLSAAGTLLAGLGTTRIWEWIDALVGGL